jgi:toxin HigB-1
MEVQFAKSDLESMEPADGPTGSYAAAVVNGFRKVMRFVRSAVDERDFRAMRSLNFEKLKGDRSHQHSLRLNDQWRLIVEIQKGNPKNTIVVIGIEDYH